MNLRTQFRRFGSALRLLLAGACLTVAASAQVSINSGGAAAGTFVADSQFNGGTAAKNTAVIDTSAVANPAPQAVYQSERWGAFTYTIKGLKSGTTYTARLHFAEFYWNAAGQRQFNVSINGTQVLNNFDIVAAAGGAKKAIAKEFPATATGGQVIIAFTKGAFNNPKISGIEISDSTPPPPPPPPGAVRINTGGPAVDPFLVDQYFVGGKTALTANAIDISGAAHPAPKAVYQTERWGASTYTVPNLRAGASYLVRLHFAEIYHKAAGLRKFNVSVNDRKVLSDFDIFAQAGAMNKAISWDHYTLANAQGQVVIALTPGMVNEPKISGIEVVLMDPPAPPVAPSALTATDASTTTAISVALSWTASPTAGVSYFVYRSNTSGFTPSASNRISIKANGATGGADTTLEPNTTYYYVVTAANDAGESAASNEATVTTPDLPALTTIEVSPETITISQAQTAQFTAVGKDQNGNLMDIIPTWTASGGTISQSGLFKPESNPTTKPYVDFEMPAMNTGNPVIGKLYNVANPTNYKILILVSGNMQKWFDKTHIQPNGFPNPGEVTAVPIAADGTYKIVNWAGLPGKFNEWDIKTPYLGIWVVAKSFDTRWPTYMVEGTAIPQKVLDATLTSCIRDRNGKAYRTPVLDAASDAGVGADAAVTGTFTVTATSGKVAGSASVIVVP